jgi:ribulose bisphosphate carboxylase small subunit
MRVFSDLKETTPDEVFDAIEQCVTAAASFYVRSNSVDPMIDIHALNDFMHWANNRGYEVPIPCFDDPELEEELK